jgi:transcription antitermination factor NusG
VIHTYSGFEQKVKTSLEEQFERSESKENLGEIIIPTEEVVEVRKGKKKISSRKFFPGYVLISVDMTQDIWYMIKNTAKVTGFLGGGGRPVPLPEKEIQLIMGQMSCVISTLIRTYPGKNFLEEIFFFPLRTSTTSSVGMIISPKLSLLSERSNCSSRLAFTFCSKPE